LKKYLTGQAGHDGETTKCDQGKYEQFFQHRMGVSHIDTDYRGRSRRDTT